MQKSKAIILKKIKKKERKREGGKEGRREGEKERRREGEERRREGRKEPHPDRLMDGHSLLQICLSATRKEEQKVRMKRKRKQACIKLSIKGFGDGEPLPLYL